MESEMNMEFCKSNKTEEQTLSFLLDNIPNEIRKKAEKELKETEEKRTERLKILKEKIKNDKTLRDITFHDDALIMFLRHSKFDVQRTLKRIDTKTSFKKNRSIYKGISEQDFSKIKAANIFTLLPKRNREGCVLLIIKYGNWDPDEVSWQDFTRFGMSLIEQSLRDPVTQISGIIGIHDFENLSFKSIRQFTPSNSYEAVKAFYGCMPARYKEIHVINQPVAFKIIWTILKPLFSEKLRKRIILHSSPDELCDYMPSSVVPVEYGGQLNVESYEPILSEWMKNACDQQRQCPMGGQSNYY